MIFKLAIFVAIVAVTNGQFGFKPPGLSSVSNIAAKAGEAASNLSPDQLVKVTEAWESFQKNAGKYTDPSELLKRKDIFTKNWQLVTEYGQKFLSGATKFNLKLNSLADLLPTEFNDLFNGYGKSTKRASAPPPSPPETTPASNTLPTSIDWRQKGGVTPVKSQNKCAGCYAFSAMGALEGQVFRKTGALNEFSPQNIIDCSKNYSNWGCLGGYVDEAFNYVKDNGITPLPQYPFEAKDGECHHDAENTKIGVKGFVLLPEGDEKALAEAVATKGPVSVAIDASQPTMQLYGNGVYYDEKAKNGGADLNHAVLVVGYDVDADGTPYWIVKNSYGPDWGEEGYVKIAKDKNNHCGIATAAYYPLV